MGELIELQQLRQECSIGDHDNSALVSLTPYITDLNLIVYNINNEESELIDHLRSNLSSNFASNKLREF